MNIKIKNKINLTLVLKRNIHISGIACGRTGGLGRFSSSLNSKIKMLPKNLSYKNPNFAFNAQLNAKKANALAANAKNEFDRLQNIYAISKSNNRLYAQKRRDAFLKSKKEKELIASNEKKLDSQATRDPKNYQSDPRLLVTERPLIYLI